MAGILSKELASYIKAPPPAANEWSRSLDSLIAKANFGIEREVRRKLLKERAMLTFPTLDPSFLTMCGHWLQISQSEGKIRIQLPRFAVFRLDNASFEMEGFVSVSWHCPEIYITHGVHAKNDIPTPMQSSLVSDLNNERSSRYQVEKSRYSSGRTSVTWTAQTTFCGLIPEKIKEKIREEQHLFDQILIIAEASTWNVQWKDVSVSSSDPLLIGVINDTLFLLDEFDCTNVENYAAREFSKTKKGDVNE